MVDYTKTRMMTNFLMIDLVLYIANFWVSSEGCDQYYSKWIPIDSIISLITIICSIAEEKYTGLKERLHAKHFIENHVRTVCS